MKLAAIFPETLPLKKARAISFLNTIEELSKLIPTTLIIPMDSAPKEEIEKFYSIDLSYVNLLYIPKSFWKVKSHKIFNFFFKKHIPNFDIFFVRHLKTAQFLINHKRQTQKLIFEVHEIFYQTLKEMGGSFKKIEKVRKLEEEVYTKSDGLIFINKTLQTKVNETFKTRSIPQKVVYLGTKILYPFKEKDFSKINEIFYTGSLYNWKGIEFLIKAFSKLPSHITLNIIGDNTREGGKKLKKLSRALGVENRIKFWGYRPPGEVAEILFNRAKLTVIPNSKSVFNFFSFPIKLLEYLSTSNLVLASATPVIRELIVPEKNGFLFEIEDIESFVDVFQQILNLTPSQLLGIVKNGYYTAQNFTYINRAKNILDFFKNCL